ncbi:hypothetical protein M405DRAFT_748213 [Rhizopogon salebrosus TDB-379]|nr:hypothetical protein M405DRAFT_748213 [Rhizopogon salebrosus TDB-379]
MISLGIEADVIAKYKPLTQEHLKVSAAIAEPNARGQRNDMLAWFWSANSTGTSEENDWMNEFYRVHWLRGKALRDRWAEEIVLVENEMDWTCNFFLHKSQEWADRILPSTTDQHPGHACYAARQSRMYRQLADDGWDAFQTVKVVNEHDD